MNILSDVPHVTVREAAPLSLRMIPRSTYPDPKRHSTTFFVADSKLHPHSARQSVTHMAERGVSQWYHF